MRNGTAPARSSRSAPSVCTLGAPRSLAIAARPLAAEAAASGTRSICRNLARLRSGVRLARYSRFSARNENSCTSVTPGSLWLKLVHSGVCTGARAKVLSTNCVKRRSSSAGGVIGMAVFVAQVAANGMFKVMRSRAAVATSL